MTMRAPRTLKSGRLVVPPLLTLFRRSRVMLRYFADLPAIVCGVGVDDGGGDDGEDRVPRGEAALLALYILRDTLQHAVSSMSETPLVSASPIRPFIPWLKARDVS